MILCKRFIASFCECIFLRVAHAHLSFILFQVFGQVWKSALTNEQPPPAEVAASLSSDWLKQGAPIFEEGSLVIASFRVLGITCKVNCIKPRAFPRNGHNVWKILVSRSAGRNAIFIRDVSKQIDDGWMEKLDAGFPTMVFRDEGWRRR